MPSPDVSNKPRQNNVAKHRNRTKEIPQPGAEAFVALSGSGRSDLACVENVN